MSVMAKPPPRDDTVKAIHDVGVSLEGKPAIIDITGNDQFFGLVSAEVVKQPKHGQVVMYPAWTQFPVFNHQLSMALDPDSGGLVDPYPLVPENEATAFSPTPTLAVFNGGFFPVNGVSMSSKHSANYIAIGDPFESCVSETPDRPCGAVYIYQRKVAQDGKIFWQFLQKLRGTEVRVGADGFADPTAAPRSPLPESAGIPGVTAVNFDRLGWSAEFNDGQLLAGAFRRVVLDEDNELLYKGAVYVYEFSRQNILGVDNPDHDNDGKPDELLVFKQELKSSLPTGPSGIEVTADFGEFFAVDGKWAAISSNNYSPLDEDGAVIPVAGALEFFQKQADGSWVQRQSFVDRRGDGTAPPAELDFFGTRVDIQGDYALSAQLPPGPGFFGCAESRNIVYVYKLNRHNTHDQSDDQWEYLQEFGDTSNPVIAPDPQNCTGIVAQFADDGTLSIDTINAFGIEPAVANYISIYQLNSQGVYELAQTLVGSPENPSGIPDIPFWDHMTHEDMLVTSRWSIGPLFFDDFTQPDILQVYQRNAQNAYTLIHEIVEAGVAPFDTNMFIGQSGYDADNLFMAVPYPDYWGFGGVVDKVLMYSTHPIAVYIPDEDNKFISVDSFKYKLTNPGGNSDIAAVRVQTIRQRPGAGRPAL